MPIVNTIFLSISINALNIIFHSFSLIIFSSLKCQLYIVQNQISFVTQPDSLCPLLEYSSFAFITITDTWIFVVFFFFHASFVFPLSPIIIFFSFYWFGSQILSFLSYIVSFQNCNMNFSYQCLKLSNLPIFAHNLTLSSLTFLWLEFLSLKDIFQNLDVSAGQKTYLFALSLKVIFQGWNSTLDLSQKAERRSRFGILDWLIIFSTY